MFTKINDDIILFMSKLINRYCGVISLPTYNIVINMYHFTELNNIVYHTMKGDDLHGKRL